MLLVLREGHSCCVGFWSSGEGIPTVCVFFLVLRRGHSYCFWSSGEGIPTVFGPQERASLLVFVPQGRACLPVCFWSSGEGIPTVFIAVAGRSNGLGPVLSGNATWPVLNCPPLSADWGAQDVWSSLRLPSGKWLHLVGHNNNNSGHFYSCSSQQQGSAHCAL